MALDPSIPLQVKPLQFDFAKSATEGFKLKQLLQQDQIGNAFVFDDQDGNPVLNRQKTLANLYRADPQTAMAYEQKLALQDHWQGQRAYQQKMLQGAEEGRRIKAFNALTSRMRADLSGLYSDFEIDPRPVEQKLQDFTQRQENLFQNYRQQGMPLEQLRSQGVIPQSFDPNAVRSAINNPNAFQNVAQSWYQSNPQAADAMTDEGEPVKAPESPEYNPEDLQAQPGTGEQANQVDPQGGFVPTAAPVMKLNLGKTAGGPKLSATQQKEIKAAQLLVEASDTTKPKDLRDQLFSSAMYLKIYNKQWTPNESMMYDADKKKLVVNPYHLQALQARTNITGKNGVTIINNPNGIPLTKPADNKNQDATINASARMSRLTQIEQSFRPEWLQIGTRLGQTWSAIKDKMGVGLDAKDKADLDAFTQFKTTALTDFNSYIKELSGATVTAQEAGRILAQLPNPGTNPFNGDSPQEFLSKMKTAMQQMRIAEAKGVYMARNGLTLADSPAIERMPQIMLDYLKQSKQTIAKGNPKLSPDEVTRLGKKAVAEYFGIPLDAPTVTVPPKGKK